MASFSLAWHYAPFIWKQLTLCRPSRLSARCHDFLIVADWHCVKRAPAICVSLKDLLHSRISEMSLQLKTAAQQTKPSSPSHPFTSVKELRESPSCLKVKSSMGKPSYSTPGLLHQGIIILRPSRKEAES